MEEMELGAYIAVVRGFARVCALLAEVAEAEGLKDEFKRLEGDFTALGKILARRLCRKQAVGRRK